MPGYQFFVIFVIDFITLQDVISNLNFYFLCVLRTF